MSERVGEAERGGGCFLEFPGLAGNFLIVFSPFPPSRYLRYTHDISKFPTIIDCVERTGAVPVLVTLPHYISQAGSSESKTKQIETKRGLFGDR